MSTTEDKVKDIRISSYECIDDDFLGMSPYGIRNVLNMKISEVYKEDDDNKRKQI